MNTPNVPEVVENRGPILAYGWWEAKRRGELPATIGHPKNYVMSLEELAEYHELLQQAQELLAREAAAVSLQYRAMTKPMVPEIKWNQVNVRCTTLAHVLEYKVAYMKIELKLMNHLNRFAAARNRAEEAAEAEVRG